MDTLFLAALSWGLKLLSAGVAVLLATSVLGWLDHRNGRHFTSHLATMEGNPQALGVYLGGRILGVCILVGLVVAFA